MTKCKTATIELATNGYIVSHRESTESWVQDKDKKVFEGFDDAIASLVERTSEGEIDWLRIAVRLTNRAIGVRVAETLDTEDRAVCDNDGSETQTN